MNIIVTGTITYDYIMKFSGKFSERILPEKIDSLSLSFPIEILNKQYGGTAGNIVYNLHLLDNHASIVAPVGNDFDSYKEFLKDKNISTEFITEYKDVLTSAYFVTTDKKQNQIGSFFIGATKYARELSLSEVVLTKKDPFAVLAATDPIAMNKYVKECQNLKIPYLYDPAFEITAFSPEDLSEGIRGADIYMGNDYEIATTEKKLHLSHEELVGMVPILITTCGEKGSIIEAGERRILIKSAKATNEIDPTGAGDAYRAGFLLGFIKHLPLEICGQMGSVSAVYSIEHYGSQAHTFTKKAYLSRYKDNFGTSLYL